MKKRKILLFLAIFYLLLELTIFIVIFRKSGFLNGLFFILVMIALTGYLGSRLLKKIHLKDFLVHLQKVGVAGDVAQAVTDRLLVFFAAILLILPGILGDCLGLLLLFPLLRKWAAKVAIPCIQKMPGSFMKFGETTKGGFSSQYASYFTEFSQAAHGGPEVNTDEVIDVEVRQVKKEISE